jgi:Heavy metal binding domain
MKIHRLEINLGRRLARLSSLVVGVTLNIACVSTTPPVGANDPSSAQAESSPAPQASPALHEGHAPLPDAATGTPATAHDHSAHAAHQPAPSDGASQDHAGHARATAPAQSKQQVPMYVCPMHAEVRQAEPGRCPKCGMALEVEKPKAENPE